MARVLTKQQVLEALDRFPDEVDLDRLETTLFLLQRVEEVEAKIAAGDPGIPHEAAMRRVRQAISEAR